VKNSGKGDFMRTEESEWQEEEWTEEEWREEERKERERQQRRRQRIEEMKREKHRREMMFRYGVPGIAAAAVLCILLLVVGIIKASGKDNAEIISALGEAFGQIGKKQTRQENLQEAVSVVLQQTQAGNFSAGNKAQAGNFSAGNKAQAGNFSVGNTTQAGNTMQEGNSPVTDTVSVIGQMLFDMPRPVFEAHITEDTNGFGDEIVSSHGILIDTESGKVLAQKDGWSRINPASMTKILTVLVAAEHITDFEGTFTMTIDITDYSFQNDCSCVGFDVGEEIPVRDLFYGTVLQSGADAALGLAYYAAGSQEAFVDMMNEKLEELGLSETTHFTNCVGLYDENHYSTPYDMAVILKAAADNEFCRQVLSEHHYVTAATAEHPEGIDISNWFLRRIEDRDTHGEVLCGKTGYVDQSKSCAASLAVDHNGREYICVTAGAYNNWSCIKDHVKLYQRYLPE